MFFVSLDLKQPENEPVNKLVYVVLMVVVAQEDLQKKRFLEVHNLNEVLHLKELHQEIVEKVMRYYQEPLWVP